MSTEIWAAIIGSLVLVVVTGVGVLFWSHMTDSKEDSAAAHRKAHDLEIDMHRQATYHSEELRKADRALLEHKILVSNEYVRKSDHSEIITEVFRKLENQDKQMSAGFSGLRQWLDSKFEQFGTQLANKQDRHHT